MALRQVRPSTDVVVPPERRARSPRQQRSKLNKKGRRGIPAQPERLCGFAHAVARGEQRRQEPRRCARQERQQRGAHAGAIAGRGQALRRVRELGAGGSRQEAAQHRHARQRLQVSRRGERATEGRDSEQSADGDSLRCVLACFVV